MADATPAPRRRRFLSALRDAATRNVPLKVLALAIACGLWAFVNFGERDTEEALKVAVELRNIPAALMITSSRVDFVDVRVVGPRTLLGRIDHSQLSMPLDFSGARQGPAVFTVNVDRLNLPRGVRVVRVTPAQITVTLERVRRKSVPIQLRLEGEPPADFRVVATTLTPEKVEVSGPESLIAPLEMVATELLRLDDAASVSIRQTIPLEPLGEYVTPRPGSVEVEVAIEEILVERIFEAVPLETRSSAAGERLLDPSAVRVVVRGPRRVVEEIRPAGLVSVDVDGLGAGAHEVGVAVKIPAEAELTSIEPSSVSVKIVVPTPLSPADATPAGVALLQPPTTPPTEDSE